MSLETDPPVAGVWPAYSAFAPQEAPEGSPMRGGICYRYIARVRDDVGEGRVESPPDQLTLSAPN